MSGLGNTGSEIDGSRPLALVEAIGRILFQRRPGDPRDGLALAFGHLGAAESLNAVATVRFEPDGDLTITGTWVAGGVVIDTVGVVVPASELPEHSGLRENREPMVFASEEFGPVYGSLLTNLGPSTSLLGVPVIADDQVVGAMVVVGEGDRVWDDELLVALSVVAETVWGFVGRCEIEHDLRERAEGAELLAHIGGYLNSGDAGVAIETLEHVTAEIAGFTGAKAITHYEIGDNRAVPFLSWDIAGGFDRQVRPSTAIELGSDGWTRLVDVRIVPFGPEDEPPAAVLVPPGTAGTVSASLVGADLVGAVVIVHEPSRRSSPAHVALVGGVVDLFGQFRARMRTERDFARRRRVESVRAEIAAMFVECDAGAVDAAVVDALGRVGELFDSASVNWIDLHPERSTGTVAATWLVESGGFALGDAASFDVAPDLVSRVEPHVMTVDEIATGANSTSRNPMLIVPAVVGDRALAALALEVAPPRPEIPADEVATLVDIGRLVYQVRRRAADDAAFRRRESLDDLQLAVASRFLDPDAVDPDETLDWVMAEIAADFGADIVTLIEIADGEDLSLRSWTSGPDADRVFARLTSTIPEFESFWPAFVASGEPLAMSARDLPAPVMETLGDGDAGGLALMGAPRQGSEADLALVIAALDGRAWSGDEVAALRHVAGQVRQFLDAQAARREVLRHLALDGLITAASARLVEAEDPDRELVTTIEAIGEFFEARSVAWTDVDHDERQLSASHLWQAASVVEPASPFATIDLTEGTWDEMLPLLVRPFVVSGDELDSELQQATPESIDLVHVVVPVVVRGLPEALLVIQTDNDLRWTDTELSALNSLATVVHEVLDRDRADRLFSTTFRSAPSGQLLVAADGKVLAANESFTSLVGGDPVGMALGTFFEHATTPAELVEGEVQIVGESSRPWTRVRTAEVRLAHEAEPVTVVHVEDATTERRNREQLRWEATHDDLTGLANRRVLTEQLELAIAEGRPAILMIDVDRFKVVNDSLGHTAGDLVLVRIAERLGLSLRESDMVCRFGGDEFAVLVRQPDTDLELAATAQRVIEMLRMPIDIAGTVIIPTCSVGIAVTLPGDDVEAVMRHADAALYEAKLLGRDRYEFFDDSRRDLLQDRLRLETDLRHALLNREFVPWFQSEHDLETGAVLGLEALVRWDSPERGVVPAAEFIDVAEEMGVAPQLSRMVLDRSLVALREWADAGHATRVRVNVAAAQLQSTELPRQILNGLERWGLAPENLCVEITERSLMLDLESAVATLMRVRAMGIEVAVDDFGTGFSSLARLKELPVDTLKIDGSFVAGIDGSHTDREIVKTIIGLGRGIGLEVVAEGVENRRQAEILLELGCRRGQGWLWSHAMSSGEVPALLAANEAVR